MIANPTEILAQHKCANCKSQREFDQRVFNPQLPAGLPTVKGCTAGPLCYTTCPDVFAVIPPRTDPQLPEGGLRVVAIKNHLALQPAPDEFVCSQWSPRLAGPDGKAAN